MSLQLAAASYTYIHYALKIKEKRAAMVAKATVHKQGSVQRFKFAGRLDIQSVSGLYKNFTRRSPSEFEFLINLTGEKISKKDTAFKKAISVQERLALVLRSINYMTLSSVHSISQLPKRSRNRTAVQIRTTLQVRSIRDGKNWRGADGGDVSRFTSRPAQVVTVSSL
jgi:hypothetical protein